jgi:hypothetical protein
MTTDTSDGRVERVVAITAIVEAQIEALQTVETVCRMMLNGERPMDTGALEHCLLEVEETCIKGFDGNMDVEGVRNALGQSVGDLAGLES